jgi:serine/threonine protein kinase
VGTESKTEKSIFDAALRFGSRQERDAYVLEACGDDEKLLAGVRALLEYHDAGSFLDSPILEPAGTLDDSPISESSGTIIDKYKLLEKIGEGGMAVVYLAEQERPIHRKVALKIIKLGMDTKSVIARFEAERQALAMMDHPYIAKVLDAGATETGRPYFVMDLVAGVSITEYCDANNLSTKERLGMFIQVCRAVQHAHQKGIIHRDIKPTNIMVTRRDGKPVPKVIDFGIAKATRQRLTEKTFFTRYARIIGTPAYMSPEQADLSDSDIDTRSDIYSLGVLLYELLTGTTPFSEEELRKAGYLEMQRIIREKEPSKPSTRLTTLGETLTDIARSRSCTPDLLTKAIRGDLDWIVMKTLQKARDRRYDNANALALDVQRHLDNEPVLARAPSASYRLGKFLRRHRSEGVVAASIMILIGAVIALLAMWNLNRREFAKAESLRVEAESLRDEKILYQAQGSFYKGDLPAALETVESILDSEHVGSEAKFFYASIYLHRAKRHESLDDKSSAIADMKRYVNILDPLETTNKDRHSSNSMLMGLWRSTPENLGPIVNSSSYDGGPSISPDGLELYFTSNRPDGYGSFDIWVTTRETVQDPWGEPKNLGPLINNSDLDGTPCISANGLELYYSSRSPGGLGNTQIWITKRVNISEPWGEPESLGPIVNGLFDAGGPGISKDGLALLLSIGRPGGSGKPDLWVTERPSVSDPWGTPENLGPTVNSPAWDFEPSLSTDGLSMFFCSTRPGGCGDWDIWMTRRATENHDWGTPINLGPAVNSSPDQGNPSISADGSTLYFQSARPGGSGSDDLWKMTILIEPGNSQKDGRTDLIKKKALEDPDGEEG